jgi:hypothetical protein
MNANKDKLEQFITDNKDLFNYHTPSEGLKQRIKKELSSKKNQGRSVSIKRACLYKYSAAAAVVAAALLLIFFYVRNKNKQPANQPPIAKTGSLPTTDSNGNKKEENLTGPIDTQGQKEKQAIITEKKQEKNENTFPEEVNDEELYHYTRLIEIKQQQMETLKQTAPELYREFARDMKILENSYKELKGQLQQDGDKEQLMEAMIENLKIQTALLSRQLEIYKESRREKRNGKTSYDQPLPLHTSTV